METERLPTKFQRIWKLEELLLTTSAGMTATELANHFNVNRRTIYRDLDLLSELGIPLYKEDSYQGTFKILGTYKIPSYRPQLLEQMK